MMQANSIRSRRTRGQAIVLVTLGLLAMCGLMGLAVDVGWSMFVEKQAQASADTAALAAVEEAMQRLSITSDFTCAGSTAVSCAAAPVTCSSLSGDTTNNLWNGCLYAVKNGFTDGNTGPVQTVTVQANDGDNLPTIAPGVNDVAYWVTVRTTQQIPQLFSSVLGNTQGVAAASGTAAIVATVVPSSFYALNREGDCTSIAGPNTYSGGFDRFCGVDINIGGGAGQPSGICPGGTVAASICAGNGITLASTCHGDGTQTGCSDPNGGGGGGGGKGGGGGNGNWAGQTGNGNGGINVWALTSLVRSQPGSGGSSTNTGAVNNPQNWDPVPTATSSTLPFEDPYRGTADPPLAVPNSALPKCGIPSGTINNTTGSQLVLGPYQYYATDNVGNPTGLPIRLSGDIRFDSSGGCNTGSGIAAFPSTGASSLSGQFPAYLFYGGLDTGTNTHFGPGQYISVGVKNPQSPSLLIGGGNRTITGDTTIGTQFITTNSHNPYLASQISPGGTADPTMQSVVSQTPYYGSIQLQGGQSTSLQLSGINKNQLPSAVSFLEKYANNMIWQDRHNSTVLFDTNGNVIDRPCANGCSTIPPSLTSLGVTAYSPEFNFQAALQMNLNGVIYQPRGAWARIQANTDVTSAVRIVTGMVWMQGNGTIHLLPSAAPIIKYTVALIH